MITGRRDNLGRIGGEGGTAPPFVLAGPWLLRPCAKHGHATARGRATHLRRRGGFTLLELIVVLGLVGMLLALAAPSLRGFVASRQTADAAAQMLALTQLAGSRSAAQGCVYRLNLDPKTNTYWLTCWREGTFADLGCEFGRCFQLPEGTTMHIQCQSGNLPVPYIEFHPNGRTEEATIELVGRQGEVYRLTCESATEAFRIVSSEEPERS